MFAKDLSEDQAACMIQGMYRSHKARQMMRKILSNRFEKIWDEESKRFYYVNKKTGDVNWDKPKLLGDDDIDPTPSSRKLAAAAGVDMPPPHKRTPRVFAKDLSEDQAASMIQGMYRSHTARHMLRKILSNRFEKIWDEENQRFYYVNKKTATGTSPNCSQWRMTWTPRHAAARRRGGRYRRAAALSQNARAFASPEDAACMLQRFVRGTKTHGYVCQRHQKAYDQEAKMFYYFNSVTGDVSWEKPLLLGDADLELTPRSKALAIQDGLLPPRQSCPRHRAADLTEDAAARIIQ